MSWKFISAWASTKSGIKYEIDIWGVLRSCDQPRHLSWPWLLGPYSRYFIISSKSNLCYVFMIGNNRNWLSSSHEGIRTCCLLVQKGTQSSWNYFIWSLDLFQLPDGVEGASSVSPALPSAARWICLVWQASWELTGSMCDLLSMPVTGIHFFLLLTYDKSSQTSHCNLYKTAFFLSFCSAGESAGN